MDHHAISHVTQMTMRGLQDYLRERGVVISGIRRASLEDLCLRASEIGLEVDPDGLLEDRTEILQSKLTTPNGVILQNPYHICVSPNISSLPLITGIDIYNYLKQCSDYTHSTLRQFHKMEGYGLFEDGHVMDLQCGPFPEDPHFFIVHSHVKPRTRDEDPLTKLKYYKTWIILVHIDEEEEGQAEPTPIFSAYCTCKGG